MTEVGKSSRKIHEDRFQESGKEILDDTRVFQQRAQIDTTGLSGPAAHELEAGYRPIELKGGVAVRKLDKSNPKDAEALQFHKEQNEREVLRGD